jgi:hypothetical protein
MGKQRRTTKAQAAGHLTPPPKIVSRKCSGIEDLARLDHMREVFEADAERWKAGKWTKADLKAVFGYWIGYPSLLEMVGHDWRADPTRSAAYRALNYVHYHATHVLTVEAAKRGLDPHPLRECARVIQEIYGREPWKYYAGQHDLWPECMGDARYTLPTGQQDALRAGEAVFFRLIAAMEIAEAPDMDTIQKAVTEKLERQSAKVTGGAAPMKERFVFGAGQVLFDNKDIGLRPGLAVEVLRKLVEKLGTAVNYKELDENSDEGEASQQLRTAKSEITRVLKKHCVPCDVETKRAAAYLLKEIAAQHKQVTKKLRRPQ